MLYLNMYLQNNDTKGLSSYLDTLMNKSTLVYGPNILENGCRDAIVIGRREIVQVYLDKGLNPNSQAEIDIDGRYSERLIKIAARVGVLPIVKMFVEKGARLKNDPYTSGLWGNGDPLISAIQGGHAEIAEYLLENGVNPDSGFSVCPDLSVLAKAAFENQKEIVACLIRHGANVRNALAFIEDMYHKDYAGYSRQLRSYSDEDRKFIEEKYSSQELKELDEKKQKLISERDAFVRKYSASVQLLLDHAIGLDLEGECISGRYYRGFHFLKRLNISGFNFIGVSVSGIPVSREMLKAQGLEGADKALVTLEDLKVLEDRERRKLLKEKMQEILQKHDKVVNTDKTITFVPKGVHS